MPHFTSRVSDLEAVGPLIDVKLMPSQSAAQARSKAGQPVPRPIQAVAMIDTGASASVVKEGICQQLGLNPVGQVAINTPSHDNIQCFTYALGLIIPTARIATSLDVLFIETSLQGQNLQ